MSTQTYRVQYRSRLTGHSWLNVSTTIIPAFDDRRDAAAAARLLVANKVHWVGALAEPFETRVRAVVAR